jgi:ribonucleotide monophosphatase NagD (HAD superfamily)
VPLASILASTGYVKPRNPAKPAEDTELVKEYEVVGKPNPFTIDLVQKHSQVESKKRMVMIGDRPNTDI